MVERLAALAHEQWSGWMEYLFGKCYPNHDGSLTLPQIYVLRWRRQAKTPYADLPESEKESDRIEARRILEIANGK